MMKRENDDVCSNNVELSKSPHKHAMGEMRIGAQDETSRALSCDEEEDFGSVRGHLMFYAMQRTEKKNTSARVSVVVLVDELGEKKRKCKHRRTKQ